jgi:transposase-like protein
MPRMYSSSVRRQIVARLRSGEPVAVVAAELGVSPATLYNWRRTYGIPTPPRSSRSCASRTPD